MKKKYPQIVPGEKRLKLLTARIVFFVLGRAFQSGSIHDPDIRKEIEVWPEGFILVLSILPKGPRMVLEKTGKRLIFRGEKPHGGNLVINFKNIESAFLVLTPQMGPSQAFAERRMTVEGSLGNAMVFTRCLNIILAYLYPRFLSRKLLKRVPEMPFQKQTRRLFIYVLGIPLNL